MLAAVSVRGVFSLKTCIKGVQFIWKRREFLASVNWLFSVCAYSLFAPLIPRARLLLVSAYAAESPALNASSRALSALRLSAMASD